MLRFWTIINIYTHRLVHILSSKWHFHSVGDYRLLTAVVLKHVKFCREIYLALLSCSELEEESPIINWSLELGTRLDSRLYALWNRTAGDCLLDSVLQATWGIYDKDSVLRKTLHDSLHDCSHW